MPKTTIPLVLPATARSWAKSIGASAKDQQLINGVYEVAGSGLVGNKTVYCTKRAGSSSGSSVGSSSLTAFTHNSSLFTNQFCQAVSAGSNKIFTTTGTALGVAGLSTRTANNYCLVDSQVGSVGILAWVGTSNDGWFLYSDAISTNFQTFTGDTHTNTVIDNIASTTGLYPGQAISGTGIQAATRIATITSATAITTTLATTATNAGVTITKEAISKIISANFPSTVNSVAAINGRFFWGSSNGRIYQSALNDPSTYTVGEYTTADYSGDGLVSVYRVGESICAFGSINTIQFFSYGQTAVGSVLVKGPVIDGMGIPNTQPFIFDGKVYCLAKSVLGVQIGLYVLNGTSLQRVSNDLWSSVITDYCEAAISKVYFGSIINGDKNLLAIYENVGSNNFDTIVYDPSTGEFAIIANLSITSLAGQTFTKSGSTTLFSWATGNTWQDSGASYTLTAQFEPKSLNGGKPIIVNSYDLIANTESSGTATLSYSDDDEATWTAYDETFDMTSQLKRIQPGGRFESSVGLKIAHSANAPFSAQGIIVDWEAAA